MTELEKDLKELEDWLYPEDRQRLRFFGRVPFEPILKFFQVFFQFCHRFPPLYLAFLFENRKHFLCVRVSLCRRFCKPVDGFR